VDYSNITYFFSSHNRFFAVFNRIFLQSYKKSSLLAQWSILISFCWMVRILVSLIYSQTFYSRLHRISSILRWSNTWLYDLSWHFRHFTICRISLILSEENPIPNRFPYFRMYFLTFRTTCMNRLFLNPDLNLGIMSSSSIRRSSSKFI